MEEALLVQSFDSLWFFSNVLSSSKTKPNFRSFDGKTAVEENPERPISPICQNDLNESPTPNADFAAETEKLQINVPDLGIAVEEAEDQNLAVKKEEKGRSRRRKRRRSRRKVLGELELGLGVDLGINYEVDGGFNGIDEKHLVKMPPLSDGLAMKEHIKYWAYAVACTVR